MATKFKKYFLDIIYLWVAAAAALVYAVSGDTGYLIASLIAPITQHFHEKDNK